MLPMPYIHPSAREPTPKSRSRRGCLTCRRRRLKCDEISPICENCRSDERTCKWGLKASFHPSRMRCLSESEAAFIGSLEARQRRPKILKFVDNTEEIESEYLTYGHGFENSDRSEGDEDYDVFSLETLNPLHPSSTVQPDTTQPPAETFDPGSIAYPVVFTQPSASMARSPSSFSSPNTRNFPHGQDPGIGNGHSVNLRPESFAENHALHTASPATMTTVSSYHNDKMPPWPINSRTKARLVASYLRETATWCETTDTTRHFSLESAHSVFASQALGAAAAAVASRQQDNTTGEARVETLELYDFARETICALEPWQDDEIVLASAVQLCVYCMMSMEVNEWRLHLRGCAGTFQEMGWNGSSGGLPAACFWAFARIDIWAAYLTQQTTLVPTDFWMSPDYADSDSSPLQDRYANKAIWIFARIINELSEYNKSSSKGRESSLESFANLWKELDTWQKDRPVCVQSVIEVEPATGEAFPFILFGNSSAICGNIFYHTGCLLLLETGSRQLVTGDNSGVEFTPLWHARRIGGISTTTDNHANLVNNLQPVFIAANHYKEASEKIAILKHLKDIEVSTGWKTGSRSAEIRGLWGLG